MAWQDLTTLYRGQPWYGSTANALQASREVPTLAKIAGLSADDLSRLGGKWWTADPAKASEYAGTGKIKSIQLKPGDIGKINKFGQKVTELPSGKYRFLGLGTPPGSQNQYLLPESILKNRPSKINITETLKNLGKQYSDEGLAFLKKNAFRTLAMLGSLPAQVGIMALAPTSMGDVSDFESQENQRLISLQNQVTAQANREARERVGRGEARDYGHTQTRSSSGWRSDPMWKGGIVDLYRYGGFI